MRYLVLAFIGLIAQAAVLAVWAGGGLELMEMLGVLSFVDLAFCAVAFVVWMPREARRFDIAHWPRFAAAMAGGLCFAFPLFLHAREKKRAVVA